MNIDKSLLREKIIKFKIDVETYRDLRGQSRDRCSPAIIKNHDEIEKTQSALIRKYAGLEKYIVKIGGNLRVNDGVGNVYSPYENAFTLDVYRVKQSINAIIPDLDYIIGKLDSLTQDELDKMLQSNYHKYVDEGRLEELKSIKNDDFDLTKLIKYCEELNSSYGDERYHSSVMLLRSIIDHIPPIFKCEKFSEVTNNYECEKSFKDSMKNLENSSRKIADSFLHSPIRKREILPNSTQVNFSNDLDVLLGEICRILK